MSVSKEVMQNLYRTMVRIREFEGRVQELFAAGEMPGFVHLSLGQEAAAAGVAQCLRETDYSVPTHRGHGQMIAKGADPKYMMAELFGRDTGYCHGKGGSMHMAIIEKGIMGSNGILGASLSIGTGVALGIAYRNSDQVCACMFGDATTNEGAFHEALNLASINKLPIVFVCENNYYGISMSQARHVAIKDIAERSAAYGIPGIAVDGNDVLAVYEAANEAVARARSGQGPTLLELKTYRWRGHFEGDAATYRPKEEVEAWMKKEPIGRFEAVLKENGIMTDEDFAAVKAAAKAEIDEAVEFSRNSPLPSVESIGVDVYSNIVVEVPVR